MNYDDIIGNTYGRLTVLRYVGNAQYECRCSCGNITSTPTRYRLIRGESQSCSCLFKELASKRLKTHGKSSTAEYRCYKRMRNRCYLKTLSDYPDYGGRGIAVCDRWRHSFENFLADMGERPSSQHSIDRKDNDGDYTPENCRWATQEQQQRNKRNNHIQEYDGEAKCLKEWSQDARCRVSYGTLQARLSYYGWSFGVALLTPPTVTVAERLRLRRDKIGLVEIQQPLKQIGEGT